MAGLGEHLRQVRESKGLTLQDAQRATKIRCRHLQALEEDSLDPKLGVVYYRGFLRAYARFLEVDAEPLLKELKLAAPPATVADVASTEPVKIKVPESGSRRSPRPIRRRYLQRGPSPWVTLAVLLLLLASVYLLLLRPSDETSDPPSPPPVNGSVDPTPSPVDPTPAPDDTPEPPLEAEREDVGATRTNFRLAVQELELVLLVMPGEDNHCWVRVTADGNRVFEGILEPGTQTSHSAQQEIVLRVGKPWVLDMELNGVELGKAGVRGPAKDIYLWGEQP